MGAIPIKQTLCLLSYDYLRIVFQDTNSLLHNNDDVPGNINYRKITQSHVTQQNRVSLLHGD